MRQLPTELSCSIFELLNLADRISATHVCKPWRTLALGYGQLWSSIRCRNARTLACLLERTHGVPVDVQIIDISLSNLDELVTLIGTHMEHIRLLALHSGEVKLKLDLVPVIHRAFARAAPLLEVVDIQLFDQPFPYNLAPAIDDAHAARGPCLVPEDSFLHLAPLLRQLSFRNMPLPEAASNVFSRVKTLELDAIRLSATQVLALVSLPCLRSLHLDVVECEVPRVPAPSTFRLDSLWFAGPYSTPWEDPVDPILRYLGFPQVLRFTSDWEALWPVLISQVRSLPHTLLVERWCVERWNIRTEAWRLIDNAGFVTDMLDMHSCDLFSRPDEQRMLANLRELVIVYHELRMADDTSVEFRNLTRLCVRVSASDCARSEWPATRGLPAPQVRTLEWWGGIEESKVTIRADSVTSFVRDFLILDRDRPPELIFRDVGLAAHSSDELDRLKELVAGIRHHEGSAPDSFVVELKSRWHASVRP